MNTCSVILWLACLGIENASLVQEGASDLALLGGQWRAEVRTPLGAKLKVLMTIEGERVTWTADHMVTRTPQTSTAKLTLDENSSPKQWNLTGFATEGSDEHLPAMKAVYRLEGDTLTLCVSPRPKDPRPTEIVADTGKGPLCTVEFRRVTP
jgi:uncharacterized protein (TIGR03067 family)